MRIIKKRRQQSSRVNGKRIQAVKNSNLYRELQRYQEEGIQLWLNGKPSTSYQIADCVCEKTNYMRDYQMDCQNQICGIGFDRIGREYAQAAQSPCVQSLRNYENFLNKSKFVRKAPKGMLY